MIQIRKSETRGQADHGWLVSKHTFSFADYHDPQQMGYSVLRVINEDKIREGTGFSTHGHKDMEIVSYVIRGLLEHKDSMGNSTLIKPGEVQRMSAGTGVRHSEYNYSKTEAAHFLQIWILPDRQGYQPGYGQKDFTEQLKQNDLVLMVSQHGRDGTIKINQDVDIYGLKSEVSAERILNTDVARSYWIQNISGILQVNDMKLSVGDGAKITAESRLHLKWQASAEFLLFDLP